MRLKKLWIFCCVTLVAMATGAPRRGRPGKSGERKRQRNMRKNTLTTVLPVRTDEEESENEALLAEFIRMDLNEDEYISMSEFKKDKGNGFKPVFLRADKDNSKTITLEEFMSHMAELTSMTGMSNVPCDKFAMERCGDKFSEHLQNQRRNIRRSNQNLSTTGLFCASLQTYMNCIGHERSICDELQSYAQRIKRTGVAYRNAGICPEMDVSVFSQRNPDRRQRPEREGERTRSRDTRSTNERTLSNEECLTDAFSLCHDNLYDALGKRSKRCPLAKKYLSCLRSSTEACRDKRQVKAIISGLKYISKVHRKENICVLQT